MTQSKFLIRTSGALALVALLSACGGSDNTPEPDPDPPTTTPEPTPPASVEQLSLDINAAEANAMAAKKMADGARETAKENAGMLSTEEVAGDSGVALKAAQAILDAKMAVETAHTNAENALEAAKTAQTAVMALADDHPHKAALTTRVNQVIEDVDGYVTEIKGIRDGADMEDYVYEVMGEDEKGTPRSVANMVGEAIAATLALADTASNNNLTRAVGAHTDGSIPTGFTAADDDLKLRMDDAKGNTWEEIVENRGGAVVTMPLGTPGNAGNVGLKVAKIAGMKVADVWNTEAERPTGTIDDGTEHDNADYMGIPGTVYCLGDDCKMTDGELEGSWYFAATNASTHYVVNPNRTDRRTTRYTPETLYAVFGHWLDDDANDDGTTGDWQFNSFATAEGEGTNAVAMGADVEGLDDGNKASYSGDAIGMSVRTRGTGDDKTTDSGRFTADVKLNATFSATPSVTGTINNFAGDAVNPAWTVSLGDATFSGAADLASAYGTAVTNGRDGRWSARAYGTSTTEDPARPTGFYGGFSVHFSDGDAAGAYATRKD